MPEVINIIPEEGLRERLGVRGRLIFHIGLKSLHGKGHVCNVHRGYTQIYYVSADPEGNNRFILDIKEPHYREIRELIVNDACHPSHA